MENEVGQKSSTHTRYEKRIALHSPSWKAWRKDIKKSRQRTRVILKCILKKEHMEERTTFIWHKIGKSSNLFWICQYISGFHEWREISWLAERYKFSRTLLHECRHVVFNRLCYGALTGRTTFEGDKCCLHLQVGGLHDELWRPWKGPGPGCFSVSWIIG